MFYRLNEGDHVRIISMRPGGDVKAVFALLSKGAKMIEDGVKTVTGKETAFMMHPKFGSVTCCPSNIGTGMRGSVHVLVPKLIAAWGFDKIDTEARQRNCQARGSSGEHSEVVDRIDVSNWRRIGLPEYELVMDMINCVNWLVEQEDAQKDPLYDLILDDQIAKNEYPKATQFILLHAHHTHAVAACV